MSFTADLSNFARKTGITGTQILRAVCLRALFNLQLVSPVDTGRFRGSWRVAVNSVDLTMLDPLLPYDKYSKYKPSGAPLGGQAAFDEGSAVIDGAVLGQTVVLSNNLPYAEKLESGTGSAQAPNGVVSVVVAQLQADLTSIVKQYA